MLVSYRWLQEMVPVDVPPAELSEKLMLAGIENTIKPAVNAVLKNVLCGEITEIREHSDADNLFVCMVSTGDREYPVVTGAPNIEVGKKIPIAIPGSVTAGGVQIGITKVRGVESHGMVCSPDELGIGEINLPHELKEGILILPDDAPLGADIQDIIHVDDTIFDLELTTNRSDCLSMVGVAHEVSALYDLPLNLPEVVANEKGSARSDEIASLEVVDPELCPRCTARVIQNVTIEPSPFWMQEKLRACGIRPINNIVDITNFVMMEYGQPMHAYDFDKLQGGRLIVRRAQDGECITTLDGEERKLDRSILVVADAEMPVGLAGVMGGFDTEITENTSTVLLEAAAFKGINIRKTYMRFNMRSEAAARFEKDVDINQVQIAMDRAAQLIETVNAGHAAKGMLDVYTSFKEPGSITMRTSRLNYLLGTHMSNQEVIQIIKRLDFALEDVSEDTITVTVPTRRGNIITESDLIEEVSRVYGFNNVAVTLPYGRTAQGSKPLPVIVEERVKAILSSVGLMEVMTFSFMAREMFDRILLNQEDEKRKAIPLQNPLSEDQAIMRTTLLPSLLEVMQYNAGRQIHDLQIYEIANVYETDRLPLSELPKEKPTLACVAGGRNSAVNWRNRSEVFDFHMLKGILETLLNGLNMEGFWFKKSSHPTYHPGRYAEIWHGSSKAGEIGEIHPHVVKEFGLSQRINAFELDFAYLTDQALLVPEYKPLPRFPAVDRDLAVIVKNDIEQQQVCDMIESIGGDLLESTTLFDVYYGEPLPEGHKSLGYSLVFRHRNKTLTDGDVDQVIQGIIAVLAENLKARIRE